MRAAGVAFPPRDEGGEDQRALGWSGLGDDARVRRGVRRCCCYEGYKVTRMRQARRPAPPARQWQCRKGGGGREVGARWRSSAEASSHDLREVGRPCGWNTEGGGCGRQRCDSSFCNVGYCARYSGGAVGLRVGLRACVGDGRVALARVGWRWCAGAAWVVGARESADRASGRWAFGGGPSRVAAFTVRARGEGSRGMFG